MSSRGKNVSSIDQAVTAVTAQTTRVFGYLLLSLLGMVLYASPAAAQSVEVDAAARSSLALTVGQGRLLKFDQPVESVFLANPSIADIKVVSADTVYIFGKSSGDTNLIVIDDRQDSRASMRIRVRANDAMANDTLRALSASDAPVRVRSVGDQLLVRGGNDSIANAIDTQAVLRQNMPDNGSVLDHSTYEPATQINIRVRFAELSRNKLRRYGINWSALLNSGSFSFGLMTGSGAASGAANGAFNTASVGYTSGNDSIQTLLNALQSDGLVKILAEPNITTVTGQTASFLAGGEIPVPVPVNSELVGIDYKRFGVSLLCTPALLPDGRISMQVRPEVSSLVSGNNVQIAGFNIPALQVRSADTVVQVGSGQTFAIAGLFQRNDSSDLQQIPVIGDIPIIGKLFRSRQFQQNETELVLLITPYIVEPSSTRPPGTPLDAQNSDEIRGSDIASQGDFGFYLH